MEVIPVNELPESMSGGLKKMAVSLNNSNAQVSYALHCGQHTVNANELIGRTLTITYAGSIHCLHCNRKTRKSFSQGYCYPCFQSLAQCDSCIVSPEKCHYHMGTCRDPAWGDDFCMNDHIVYLANSSAPKIGITRATQIPTRWVDQGAAQALPILKTSSRRIAGLVEVIYKPHISDRTQWQRMLKATPEDIDLHQLALELQAKVAPEIKTIQNEFGTDCMTDLVSNDTKSTRIHYPVNSHPVKVKSVNLDKTPVFTGELTGIKGQYLIFGDQVLNVRKFGGYHVDISISNS
ncbi:DUF2797 domain-containing protein [Gilvimarinus sp. 1_MG-2023]|uniref:DUF2797 domain-containing protein n=1 Tax=Gilvimarinus sp. 1_MG-2023 TaxID=3062638 RepID=UPI0026E20D00|nr:DUF2797 domain-containing protein [Gilvimarinus sp. 1_MG-2023]MDO6745876.1 DUF2797 domain-containing protein [Gilvimarinus sp. 1_MG-2023]